jgi:hypothetical protein
MMEQQKSLHPEDSVPPGISVITGSAETVDAANKYRTVHRPSNSIVSTNMSSPIMGQSEDDNNATV